MAKSRNLRIKIRRKRLRIAAIFCILFVAGNILAGSELPSLLWKMGRMALALVLFSIRFLDSIT